MSSIILDAAAAAVESTCRSDAEDGGAAPASCEVYRGELAGPGDWEAQPGGSWYFCPDGTHEGWLEAAAEAELVLELYKSTSVSWTRVAPQPGTRPSSYVSYHGGSGYYYWRVSSRRGGGSYELRIERP